MIAGLVSVVITSAAVPASAAPPDPGTYQALTPARILDTRTGNGAPTAPVAAAATLDVTVLGQGGIPASGVSAVVFNLTDTGPTTYGFITAYPAGQPLPLASSINFSAGETRAHQVVVAPGTNGQVALYNGSAAPVDLVADVLGYYTAGTPTAGGEFAPLSPARILDTRTGNGAPEAPLDGHGSHLTLQVAGRGGVPERGATSVTINLTATRPSVFGYLWVSGNFSSSVNFRGGESVSNLVEVPLQADGTVVVADGQIGGHVDVVADVVGYFVGGVPAAAGRFGGLAPTRLLDTRLTRAPIPAQGTIDLAVAGHSGVPAGVSAAALNVTVASASTSGYLAAYPTGMARPMSSTVNFDHNTVANLVIAPLGPDGRVRIYNSASVPVQVVIDVSGYVGRVPGPLVWSTRAPIPGTNPVYSAHSLTRASCGSPTFCMAFDEGNVYRYDGHSWSAPVALGADVYAVSCVAPGSCVAITDGGPLRFNGTTWTPITVPGADGLAAVSCTSAMFCVVINNGDTTVSSWVFDGTAWTEIDVTGFRPNDGTLLSCTSPTFCLVVNRSGDTARFDGTQWVALASTTSVPDALSCVSSSFCMAVSDGAAVINNGVAWGTAVPLDVRTSVTDSLKDVDCTSSTFCMAQSEFGYQLIYDGTTWSNALVLNPPQFPQDTVTCAGPTFCMIVDFSGYTTGS